MTSDEPRLIMITGIMAAGKSTIAQHLAERLPRSVHLRGDLFRRMIVNGQAQMDFNLAPEALAQLNLRYRIAATVAGMYLTAGFNVVYQDIIIGAALREVVASLQAHPLHVVVLCPNPTVVAQREAGRNKTGYGDDTVAAFDTVLRTETPRIGLWLDTSSLTVSETVDHILARLPEASIASDYEVEDVAQETVSRVLARLDQIKAPEALVSYSLLVLRSVVKERFQRPPEASLEAGLVSGELIEPPAATLPADTVEDAMVEAELRHMIDQVLDHPLERLAIYRIVLRGDRPREVARELDLPLHRIRVHKSRALQRLRKDVDFMRRCAAMCGELYEALATAERDAGDDE